MNPFVVAVGSILVPLGLALAEALLKILGLGDGMKPRPEDALLGFTLMIAALGAQLAFIADKATDPKPSDAEASVEATVAFTVVIGLAAIVYIIVLALAIAVLMRLTGWKDKDKKSTTTLTATERKPSNPDKEPRGLAILGQNLAGLSAVMVVAALNVSVDRLWLAWGKPI